MNKMDLVLADVRAGKPIVIVDDQDRENEGDIMVAADNVSVDSLQFMINEGKGLICISLTEERLQELQIPIQVIENTSSFGTNFAVSFDHRSVFQEGVTAKSRAESIRRAVDPTQGPRDFVQPGYVFPVCARPGGVLKRRGQTEGSVDISRLAGLSAAGVICEIMADDGRMIRGAELDAFCEKFDLKIISIEEIVQYRLHHEVSIRRVAELPLDRSSGLGRGEALASLPSELFRNLRLVVYVDDVDDKEHFAIVNGAPNDSALVRIHSECLTGDVFGSCRCDCGNQFDLALRHILEGGEGALVYLHQEGRGIGLGNKLRAYQLQDTGLDTVDANISLGFAPDERNYRVGAHILRDLGLTSVRLMTNNPDKVRALEEFGISVLSRESVAVPVDPYNAAYLETKRTRMGHLLGSEQD